MKLGPIWILFPSLLLIFGCHSTIQKRNVPTAPMNGNQDDEIVASARRQLDSMNWNSDGCSSVVYNFDNRDCAYEAHATFKNTCPPLWDAFTAFPNEAFKLVIFRQPQTVWGGTARVYLAAKSKRVLYVFLGR